MPNPILSNNKNFQSDLTPPVFSENPYNMGVNHNPAVLEQPGSMTVNNTVMKVLISFAVLLVGAGAGWIFPALMIPGMIAALVIAIIFVFKKQPSAVLTLLFSAAEGLMVGGLSSILEAQLPGIVTQAVLATLCVVGVTTLLFTSGKVRATPKLNKIFMVATLSYLAFSLVNLGLMVFGVNDDPWGLRSMPVFGIPLGVLLGVLAVALGAYSLVMDYTVIEQGVQNRLPENWGWLGAYGIISSVVWIYVEILRVIAILRGR